MTLFQVRASPREVPLAQFKKTIYLCIRQSETGNPFYLRTNGLPVFHCHYQWKRTEIERLHGKDFGSS